MSLFSRLGFGARTSGRSDPLVDPPSPARRSHFPANDLSQRAGRYVGDSEDLRRILALPRRPRPTKEQLQAFQEKWKYRLQRPASSCECVVRFKRRCCSTLMPVQAWALEEMHSEGGLLGPIGVGHGKTLLDLLSALVVPNVKSAVLLIPPNLKRQLLDVDWEFYGQHWLLPNLAGGRWFFPDRPTLNVVAFSELSGAKSSDLLSRLKPDLLVIDEAHNVRNATAARTKRLIRYLKEHTDVRVLAWSGTLTSRSLKDYSHLSAAALKRQSPVPLFHPTVEEWSAAIDPSPFPLAPGALAQLDASCSPREAVQRRVLDTRGVVCSADEGGCQASLVINERRIEAPKAVLEALREVDRTWCRPDGEPLLLALDVARCAREVSAGFFYRWKWTRGESEEVITRWLKVRKAWRSELREKLKTGGVHMDSPLLLTKAAIRWYDGYAHIERDEHGNETSRYEVAPRTKRGPQPTWQAEYWPEWRAVRDTAKPETDPVWIDDFMVRDCVEWLHREGPGIVWYEHDAFGRAVAAGSGVVYAGPGREGDERLLALTGSEAVVASIRAHGTGKNLQQFNRCLVANPPSDGATWEQLVGRCHRQGQLADEVLIEVYRHTDPYRAALDKARDLAGYIQESFGAPQKLVSKANWVLAP